jgi:hypothetical protein
MTKLFAAGMVTDRNATVLLSLLVLVQARQERKAAAMAKPLWLHV